MGSGALFALVVSACATTEGATDPRIENADRLTGTRTFYIQYAYRPVRVLYTWFVFAGFMWAGQQYMFCRP